MGHGTDPQGKTGVTVILCPEGALGAADVRGTATGTRQFDSLVMPHHIAPRVHALVLAGGSAFGLSAADAVVDWLARRGHGFVTPAGPVPLVPTAILFDLAFGSAEARPARALVEAALEQAARPSPRRAVLCGSVGAGTGATVGKACGPQRAMKGGFGFASVRAPGRAGVRVAAAVAVNAFGDIREPATGRIVAGCRRTPRSRQFADAEVELASLGPAAIHPWQSHGNTTLAIVMTNAILEKPAAFKVSEMAFSGLYRTLSPAVSIVDGDLVVTLSSQRVPAHPHQVGVLAGRAIEAAILRAVREADGFGLLPAVRDLAPRRPARRSEGNRK